jgi:FMN reductase
MSYRILDYIAAKLVAAGYRTKSLRVCDLPAQSLLAANRDDPAIADALREVARARVVIIATPVYQAAYTGALKALLDLLPQGALAGKTVLPVATGSSLGQTLAVDYTLRPVLAALRAREVLGGIYVVEGQARWSSETGLKLEAELGERLRRAIAYLAQAEQPLPRPAAPNLHVDFRASLLQELG